MKQNKKLAEVKKWCALITISFILLIVQSTLNFEFIANSGPALVFSFAICCSMFLSEKDSAIFGVISGAFLDCFSSRVFLVSSLILLIFCTFVSFICTHIIRKRFISAVIIFSVLYLTYCFISFFFELLLKANGSSRVWGIFIYHIFPNLLYSVLVIPLIYFITKKIDKIFKLKKIIPEEV